MILPQEIEVFYVIPAIRRELAKALVRKGITQRKIASIFGVTEACVSNYFNTKRGAEVKLSNDIKAIIYSGADSLIKNNSCFISIIQRACREFKKTEALCTLHRKLENITCDCRGCLA